MSRFTVLLADVVSADPTFQSSILDNCNLLPRLDSGPSPRPFFHRGGYHLVDGTGFGRYPRETNPAQRKANLKKRERCRSLLTLTDSCRFLMKNEESSR